jgi:hypothetical protein
MEIIPPVKEYRVSYRAKFIEVLEKWQNIIFGGIVLAFYINRISSLKLFFSEENMYLSWWYSISFLLSTCVLFCCISYRMLNMQLLFADSGKILKHDKNLLDCKIQEYMRSMCPLFLFLLSIFLTDFGYLKNISLIIRHCRSIEDFIHIFQPSDGIFLTSFLIAFFFLIYIPIRFCNKFLNMEEKWLQSRGIFQ